MAIAQCSLSRFSFAVCCSFFSPVSAARLVRIQRAQTVLLVLALFVYVLIRSLLHFLSAFLCSHNLGMATNLKHDRLIRHCRVIDNEICFNSKEVYNL